MSGVLHCGREYFLSSVCYCEGMRSLIAVPKQGYLLIMNLFIRWVWLLFSTSVITIYSTAFLAQNAITQNALMIVSIYVIFFLQNPTHPDPACQCNISLGHVCSLSWIVQNLMHTYHTFSHGFWQHLPIFHIFTCRTIYHQFHSSIFMYTVLTTHLFVFIPNPG